MDRLRSRLAVSLAMLATTLVILGACASDGSATASVTIKSFKFAPDPITVDVGDSITWTNDDPVGHTVTAKDDSFDTEMFFPDGTATITFDTAGTFPYFCVTHPEMVGTVIVESAA